MGNRPSSSSTPGNRVGALHQVHTKEINNFQPWAYWSRLPKLACFKHTDLTDDVFHVVIVFLQMGNFTAADGSLRRYHDAELAYCLLYTSPSPRDRG